MKQYRIAEQPVTLRDGKLALTRDQAARRLHVLEGSKLKKHGTDGAARATYRLVGATQFKIGEVIGYDGEVPKPWVHIMLDLDAIRAAEAEAAAKAAEAERQAEETTRIQAQHMRLVEALRPIEGGGDGTVDVMDVDAAITAAKLDFEPTEAQLETAWQAVVAERAAAQS